MRFRTSAVAAVLFLTLPALAWSDEPRVVTFKTADGVTITADYYAPAGNSKPAPIAILLHMVHSDRTAWKGSLIDALHDVGFAVLAIDLRGHGQSGTADQKKQADQRDPALFAAMPQDVRAAYDWIVSQPNVDPARFALIGASVGCSVALRYAVSDRSVDAIVCLSPGTNYMELDSSVDVKQLLGRKLWLISSTQESQAPQALASLTSGAQTKAYDGEAHGTQLLKANPALGKSIAGFLVEAVGKPTHKDQQVFFSIEKEIYHEKGDGWIERIKPTNKRVLSSAQEAEARGLRKSKSNGPDDSPTSQPRRK